MASSLRLRVAMELFRCESGAGWREDWKKLPAWRRDHLFEVADHVIEMVRKDG